MKGFRYVQIFAPCPTGWRTPPDKTVELGKLAVESGMWTLYEIEHGKMTINKKPKMIPVKEYIKLQGRFKHMSEEDIQKLQEWVNEKWKRDMALAECLGK